MTTKLEVLKAELEQLEANDDYGALHYDWLASEVERLEREEKASPPASALAPATAPVADPFQALQAEMADALARQAAGHDVDADALLRRWNAQLADIGRSQSPDLSLSSDAVRLSRAGRGAERVDVTQLTRDMLTGVADPNLTDERAAELAQRYNAAIRQGPEGRTTEALRGELASTDLVTRMRAAAVLQQRGELSDEQADQLVADYNSEVAAAAAARGDPAEYPEHLRPIVEAQQAALRSLEEPTDPVERATKLWNDYVRAQRPPTLAALGVQVEPEPMAEPTGAGHG